MEKFLCFSLRALNGSIRCDCMNYDTHGAQCLFESFNAQYMQFEYQILFAILTPALLI